MSKKQKIIYGLMGVENALKRGTTLEQILFAESIDKNKVRFLLNIANSYNVPYKSLKDQKFEERFGALAKEKIVAIISKILFVDWQEMIKKLFADNNKIPLIIAVDRVEDPGNIGTILRTAEAAGITGFISDNTCHIINNRLMRNASAGAIFTFPIARTNNLLSTLVYAQKLGVHIVTTSSHKSVKSKLLYDLDFSRPMIVVLGSEENGVSSDLLELSDSHIIIPQFGNVESLNVAVAGAVIIYEAVRQNLGKSIKLA
jgi:23S rRNA (guanosine2251-2'-O)-methyltransferase